MPKKSYNQTNNTSPTAGEPAVAYRRMKSADVVEWNPNVPVHATQEEWWEHIHEIEKGPFMSWEEHEKKFEAWKQEKESKLNNEKREAADKTRTESKKRLEAETKIREIIAKKVAAKYAVEAAKEAATAEETPAEVEVVAVEIEETPAEVQEVIELATEAPATE